MQRQCVVNKRTNKLTSRTARERKREKFLYQGALHKYLLLKKKKSGKETGRRTKESFFLSFFFLSQQLLQREREKERDCISHLVLNPYSSCSLLLLLFICL